MRLRPGASTSLIQKAFFACSQGNDRGSLFCFESLSSKFRCLKAAVQNHGNLDPKSYSGWFGVKEGPLSPLCRSQGNPYVGCFRAQKHFFVRLNKTEKPAKRFALSPLILALFAAKSPEAPGNGLRCPGCAGRCWRALGEL